MARYDVFAHPDGRGRLLAVQSDLLDRLNTVVVVPLLRQGNAPLPAKRLNPVFDVEGEPHVMVTQFLAAVPAAMLSRPVANLSGSADDITGALDMLFHGF